MIGHAPIYAAGVGADLPDLPDGVRLWYAADDLAVGPVSSWPNRGEAGVAPLTATTDPLRPSKLAADGPVVFNGVHELRVSAFGLGADGNQNTICMRVASDSTTGSSFLLSNNDSGPSLQRNNTDPFLVFLSSNTNHPRSAANVAIGQRFSVVAVRDAANSVMNVDGVETTGDGSAAESSFNSHFTLGNSGAAGVFKRVWELLFWNRVLDASERAAVIDYLGRWA